MQNILKQNIKIVRQNNMDVSLYLMKLEDFFGLF